MENLSNVVAASRGDLDGSERCLRCVRPQQWRFDRGQPERALEQRQARQYAQARRRCRSQRRHRLARCVVVEGGYRLGRGGREEIEGRGGVRKRRDRQEDRDARRKPAPQPVAPMRPRSHEHRIPLRPEPTPPDGGATRQQRKMIPAARAVKCDQQPGYSRFGASPWPRRTTEGQSMARARALAGTQFRYTGRHRPDGGALRETGRSSRRQPL